MSTTLTIDGMNCDGCADIITGALDEVRGVESTDADLDAKTVVVEGDATTDDILEAVDFAGYEADIESGGDSEEAEDADADDDVEDSEDIEDAEADDDEE